MLKMNFQKPKFILLLFVLLSFNISAQECTAYFPFEKGVEFSYSNFNKKGKVTSKATHIVNEITSENGSLKASVSTINQDKKGNELTQTDYQVYCKDNVLEMDISSILSPGMTASIENMEVSISGDSFKLPSELKEGQEISDTYTEIKAGMNGMTIMTMGISHSNKVVEGNEKVTTDAGTFDCIKISYDVSIKMVMTKTYHVVTWYNKRVGMVKQETRNKRNKLESSSELTSFKKA